jgi:hypothetical protein
MHECQSSSCDAWLTTPAHIHHIIIIIIIIIII